MSRELHNHLLNALIKLAVTGNDVETQGSVCRKNKNKKKTRQTKDLKSSKRINMKSQYLVYNI